MSRTVYILSSTDKLGSVLRRPHSVLLGIIAALCVLTTASAAHAAGSSEEPTQLAAALRIQLIVPHQAMAPEGLWARLQHWLGARTIQRIRPPIGTQLTVLASAYAPSVYQTDSTPCITATGTRVRRGVVASNFLPMGTLLQIDNKVFIVEDRMHPRYSGYYIDIFFPHTDEALEFGRRQLTATIIGYGKPGQPLSAELSTTAGQESLPLTTSTPSSLLGDGGAAGDSQSIADRLRVQLQLVNRALTQLIGARVPPDVNRYDVNCFGENGATGQ